MNPEEPKIGNNPDTANQAVAEADEGEVEQISQEGQHEQEAGAKNPDAVVEARAEDAEKDVDATAESGVNRVEDAGGSGEQVQEAVKAGEIHKKGILGVIGTFKDKAFSIFPLIREKLRGKPISGDASVKAEDAGLKVETVKSPADAEKLVSGKTGDKSPVAPAAAEAGFMKRSLARAAEGSASRVRMLYHGGRSGWHEKGAQKIEGKVEMLEDKIKGVKDQMREEEKEMRRAAKSNETPKALRIVAASERKKAGLAAQVQRLEAERAVRLEELDRKRAKQEPFMRKRDEIAQSMVSRIEQRLLPVEGSIAKAKEKKVQLDEEISAMRKAIAEQEGELVKAKAAVRGSDPKLREERKQLRDELKKTLGSARENLKKKEKEALTLVKKVLEVEKKTIPWKLKTKAFRESANASSETETNEAKDAQKKESEDDETPEAGERDSEAQKQENGAEKKEVTKARVGAYLKQWNEWVEENEKPDYMRVSLKKFCRRFAVQPISMVEIKQLKKMVKSISASQRRRAEQEE